MERFETLFGIKFVQIGVEGLTLNDEKRMKDLLQEVPFSGYYERREFQATPVVFEKTSIVESDPEFFAPFKGKQFNGFLIRHCEGPRKTLINSDLPDYYPNEKLRWTWSLRVFSSEFEEMFPESRYPLQYLVQFDEPTLEAFEKRKIIRLRWYGDGDPKTIVWKDEREDKTLDPLDQWGK